MRIRNTIFLSGIMSFFIFSSIIASEKILIITHSYCRPDFIEIQAKTFKMFLHEDYEFVVFNDAFDSYTRHKIQLTCQNLGLRCIDIPQEIHDRPYLDREPGEDPNNANCRCANVVQYSLDILGFDHPGIVCIIDSDMFLVKEFNFEKTLGNFDLIGVPQTRGDVNYIWNGLVIFNMNTVPNKHSMNFNCGLVEGQRTDVGGNLYYYFKDNPTLKIKFSSTQYPHLLNENEFNEPMSSFIHIIANNPMYGMEFHWDFSFLHYIGGGSNWARSSYEYHQKKTCLLNYFIDETINNQLLLSEGS